MTTSLKTILTKLKTLVLDERSQDALARKKLRRRIEVGANPRGYPKQPVGEKPIDLNAWPHNKIRKPKWSIKKDPLEGSDVGESSPATRALKLKLLRKDVPKRPFGSSSSKGSSSPQDELPPAHGLVARAARHKKSGIESPLLLRMRQKRNALQSKGEELTHEELQMSEHAMLNEETGELEVSDEVSALLDGMVEVLESAGYDIEDGMEAEEFIEQVYDLLETDKDLEGAKKQALIKSYNTVAEVIEAAHCEGDDCDDDDDADDADADDGDDDEKDSEKDDKKDDEKGSKKKLPFFLKKKAAKKDDEDEDEEPADEAVEAAEGEEQEEANVSSHLKGSAQKGYKAGGWKSYTHKPGKSGSHYTIGAHNKGPKHMSVKKARV